MAYRTLVRISYPTDAEIIERLLDGEQIPMDERGMKHVAAGEIVDDIPQCSVGWMLEQEIIEPAPRLHDVREQLP